MEFVPEGPHTFREVELATVRSSARAAGAEAASTAEAKGGPTATPSATKKKKKKKAGSRWAVVCLSCEVVEGGGGGRGLSEVRWEKGEAIGGQRCPSLYVLSGDESTLLPPDVL